MGRPKNGTICSKHEEISDLAERIGDLVSKCLEDGGNMEEGLVQKAKRIFELETELRETKEELRAAEKLIASLEDDLENVRMP